MTKFFISPSLQPTSAGEAPEQEKTLREKMVTMNNEGRIHWTMSSRKYLTVLSVVTTNRDDLVLSTVLLWFQAILDETTGERCS